MRSIFIAVLMMLFASVAHADRHYSRTVVRGCATAQQDADEMARTGVLRHRSSCGCREGIGMGATAEQALANCCYYGRYAIREKAVSRGLNGRWYAVIRYAQ